MALDVPVPRHRRQAVVLAVAALVVGLFVGWLIGRGSAPSLEDGVRDVQRRSAQLTERLRALPAVQAAARDAGRDHAADVMAELDAIEADLLALFDDAPWIGPATRQLLGETLDRVGATATGSAVAFRTAVVAAVAAINLAFGTSAAA